MEPLESLGYQLQTSILSLLSYDVPMRYMNATEETILTDITFDFLSLLNNSSMNITSVEYMFDDWKKQRFLETNRDAEILFTVTASCGEMISLDDELYTFTLNKLGEYEFLLKSDPVLGLKEDSYFFVAHLSLGSITDAETNVRLYFDSLDVLDFSMDAITALELCISDFILLKAPNTLFDAKCSVTDNVDSILMLQIVGTLSSSGNSFDSLIETIFHDFNEELVQYLHSNLNE